MGRLTSGILCFITLFAPPSVEPQGGQQPHRIRERADQFLAGVEAWGFGGVVLIGWDGDIVLQKGYGFADRAAGIPLDGGDVFSVMSITKQFTAAAILTLVESGRLGLDDSLGQWFEDVPADKHAITIRQLLRHRAGLDDFFAETDWDAVGRDEYRSRILASTLVHPPGEAYRYSNAGYALLGMIIEKASGEPYEAYLRRVLFRPAGMYRTGYVIPTWNRSEIAHGYDGDEDWGTVIDHPWAPDGPFWPLRAAGGIHSTADDLFRWHVALRDHIVLPGGLVETMHQGDGTSYALGAEIRFTQLGIAYGHGGDNDVFHARFWRYPDYNAVVFVLSTGSDVHADEITPWIENFLAGADLPNPPRIADDPATPPLDGVFFLPSGDSVVLAPEDQGLAMTIPSISAYRRLVGLDDDGERRYRDLPGRLATAFRRRDFTALAEAAGEGLTTARAKEVGEALLERWSEELGSVEEVVGLGPVPLGGGATLVGVRVILARGARDLFAVTDASRIRTLSTRPLTVQFKPAPDSGWVAFSARTGTSLRLTADYDGGLRAKTASGVEVALRPTRQGVSGLTALLDSLRVSHGLPGLVVTVAGPDSILGAVAAGVQRLGASVPLSPGDRMHLGSVTKPLTATLLGRLVERGVLRWDLSLEQALPGWDIHPALRSVTLEQLLRHEGRLQGFEEDAEFEVLPPFRGSDSERRTAFARWLLARLPASPVGEHVYSNAGYSVAAVVAEHATGESWESLMERELFGPLGLRSAGFGWPAREHPGEPWGHEITGGSPRPHDPHGDYQLADQFLGPAGDVHMNLLDLAHFGQEHLRGLSGIDGLLRSETVRHLHDAPIGEYALGWNIRSFGSHHLGGAGTFSAALVIMPASDLVIAIATNADADVGVLAGSIIRPIQELFQTGR